MDYVANLDRGGLDYATVDRFEEELERFRDNISNVIETYRGMCRKINRRGLPTME